VQIDQGTQGSRGGEAAVVRQRFRETHRRGRRDAARSTGHFHMTLMSTQWRTGSHVFHQTVDQQWAFLMACLLLRSYRQTIA